MSPQPEPTFPPAVRGRSRRGGALLCATLALLGALAPAARANLTTIDFENTPSHATGPSTFGSIPEETLTVTGLASISGGAVLGNPTFYPAFPTHGSAPNAYGTSFTDTNLSPTLTITFQPGNTVTNVAGVLFNGQTDLADYTVTAFNGATQVAQQTLSNVPANTGTNDFANFSVSAPQITSITVTTAATSVDPTAYDFLIDTVAVTYTTTVPEPGSVVLLGLGGLATLGHARRRRRTPAEPAPSSADE
jgi:hypothetical protein